MKFVISLMFFCHSISASPIHLSYEEKTSEAEIYKAIMINDYRIPDDLIVLKKIDDCGKVKAVGKLDLCFKKNGDLVLVSVNRDFINESLKVFLAP